MTKNRKIEFWPQTLLKLLNTTPRLCSESIKRKLLNLKLQPFFFVHSAWQPGWSASLLPTRWGQLVWLAATAAWWAWLQSNRPTATSSFWSHKTYMGPTDWQGAAGEVRPRCDSEQERGLERHAMGYLPQNQVLWNKCSQALCCPDMSAVQQRTGVILWGVGGDGNRAWYVHRIRASRAGPEARWRSKQEDHRGMQESQEEKEESKERDRGWHSSCRGHCVWSWNCWLTQHISNSLDVVPMC